MGPGLKYHVVTIAAIFFALTIGLVVGSLIVSPRVANQQQRAIGRLQTTLNQDNITLRQKLKRWEEFGDRISPVVLKGRLAGTGVAIIQTGDYPDALASVREALQLADAHTNALLITERGLTKGDEALSAALGPLHTVNPLFPSDRAGLAEAIASVLETGSTHPNDLLPQLEAMQILHSELDSPMSFPLRYVIVIAGSRTENDPRPTRVDQPLIEALQKRGLTVVMCEPQEVVSSDAEAYRKLGVNVSTITGIDSDIGRCDLILALGATP